MAIIRTYVSLSWGVALLFVRIFLFGSFAVADLAAVVYAPLRSELYFESISFHVCCAYCFVACRARISYTDAVPRGFDMGSLDFCVVQILGVLFSDAAFSADA